jgi:hypothetical protein
MQTTSLDKYDQVIGATYVRRPIVLVIGMVLAMFWLFTPDRMNAGQTQPTFLESDAEYSYGQAMRFSLEATSPAPVRKVTLFIQATDLPNRLVAEIDAGLQENIAVDRVVDLTQLRLAPFTTVTYWWELETESGEIIQSDPETLQYVDDQFTWRTIEQEGIQVNWSGKDDEVGQATMTAVLNALSTIEAVFPTVRPEPLRIYVYPSAADLRAGLRLTGRDWVGAHAHPELGVILVAAEEPTNGSTALARSVAHELAHLYVYEAADSGYESVPLWLDEGIASMIEGAADNPIYEARLERAVTGGETFSFAELCFSMPTDEDGALLAYAQSAAFVAYLQDEYGNQSIQRLIGAIADGADCQSAPLRVLDKSLAELNEEWLGHAMPKSLVERMWLNGRVWLIVIAAGFLLVGLLARVPRGKSR